MLMISMLCKVKQSEALSAYVEPPKKGKYQHSTDKIHNNKDLTRLR